MIQGLNTEYLVRYQKHILDVILGNVAVKPLAYYGVGVGGSLLMEGQIDGYASMSPNRLGSDLFIPIPVKMVNLSVESDAEVVADEYLGIEREVSIGTAIYDLYWYKKITTVPSEFVSIADASRTVVTPEDFEDTPPNVSSAASVKLEIYGRDIIPSLWTYIHDKLIPESGNTLQIPLAISEIGVYANNDITQKDIDDCRANQLLVRHDCLFPLEIPSLSTTLHREIEFMIGHSPILFR